jgi:hypothetical protein
VNKNLESDFGTDFVSHFNYFKKLVAGEVFVLFVSINYIDQGTTLLQSGYVSGIGS